MSIIIYLYNKREIKIIKRDKEGLFSSLHFLFFIQCIIVIIRFQFGERWLSGLKRRIANPLYEFFVPRVRIPLFPFLSITWYFFIVEERCGIDKMLRTFQN